MTAPDDLERMLKGQQAPPGDIPILGQSQQVPVFTGLPVGPNETITVDDLVEMDDREFKNLFLSVIISMMGGIYVPPDRIDDLKAEAAEAGLEVADNPNTADEEEAPHGPGDDLDPED